MVDASRIETKTISAGQRFLFSIGIGRKRILRKLEEKKSVLGRDVSVRFVPACENRRRMDRFVLFCIREWRKDGLDVVLIRDDALLPYHDWFSSVFRTVSGTSLLWDCRELLFQRYCKFRNLSPYQKSVAILVDRITTRLEQTVDFLSPYVKEIKLPNISKDECISIRDRILCEYGINLIFTDRATDDAVLVLSEDRSFVEPLLSKTGAPALCLCDLRLENRKLWNFPFFRRETTGERVDLDELSLLLASEPEMKIMEMIQKERLKLVSFENIF